MVRTICPVFQATLVDFARIWNFFGARADYHFVSCHKVRATSAKVTSASRPGR